MDHAMKTTWDTYTASWKAATVAEKQALFAASLDANCTYTDPLGTASGWDALTHTMHSFHQQIPCGYFVTHHFASHHNYSMAQWKMHNGDGVEIGEGVSFGQYNDQGKLVSMTGFYDTP